jgi:hypothetical protein
VWAGECCGDAGLEFGSCSDSVYESSGFKKTRVLWCWRYAASSHDKFASRLCVVRLNFASFPASTRLIQSRSSAWRKQDLASGYDGLPRRCVLATSRIHKLKDTCVFSLKTFLCNVSGAVSSISNVWNMPSCRP